MTKSLLLGLMLCLFAFSSANAIDQAEFDKAMETYLKTDKGQASLGQSVKTFFAGEQKKAQLDKVKAQKQKLEDQFNNPLKVDIGNAPTKGPKDAKVTIVEFSDYECPYCNRGAARIEEVLKAYPNDVRVAFKNLPLSFHKNAKPAAIAALAAGKQGKFWEMHDKLFANQKKLNTSNYTKWAKEIGLDMAKYEKDFKDPALAKQVDADAAQARTVGISGTPGFLVNGVLIEGAQPLSRFKEIIDRWLAKK